MASLLSRALGRSTAPVEERGISTLDDYVAAVRNAMSGLDQSWGATRAPTLDERSALDCNGPVFAVMAVRQAAFSAISFRWQRMRDGRGADMYGTPDLARLEKPWPGGTTQDLLARMIQDADLVGNAYHILDTPLTRLGGDTTSGVEIVRVRPDWVQLLLARRHRPIGDGKSGLLGHRKIGYLYTEGGKSSGNDPVVLGLDEVSHFMPSPDPLAPFAGMSWLTPIVREVENDVLMNQHKRKFFENGATPNMIIKHAEGADREAIIAFNKRLREENGGVDNAYKALNLYPGADVTIAGANMEQIDFRQVQGAGETRIASAGGVPPILAGFSEGLASATYSNYGQARRRFSDITMHPLWQNAAGSLAVIMPDRGPDSRLWYDAENVPLLREDETDAANIAQIRAATIASLITAGYEPDSVVRAVDANDFRLLVHTGLYSVQLQPAGGADKESKQDTLARTIQQLYLGVDKVITVDEARVILNQLGAGLTVPVPDDLQPEPPAPEGATE